MKRLTDIQKKAFKAFKTEDTDVKIETIFTAVYGKVPRSLVDEWRNREMQQKLAPIFAALNRKLADDGLKIAPGELKQTYRLTKV